MSRRSHTGRRLSLEALEDRAMYAADLNVAFANGNLTITGDGAAEQFVIEQTQANILNGIPLTLITLKGEPGTTLNGQAQLNFFAASVNNVTVDLKGGNDAVLVKNMNLPTSPINWTFRGGFGEDRLFLDSNKLAGNVTILGEGNDDQVVLINTTIAGQLTIDTANGNDLVGIVDSVVDNLNIKTGDNQDFVSLQRAQALNQIFVDLGDGDDILQLDTIRAGSLSFLAGDNDDDTLIIKRRTGRELFLLAAADDFETLQFI